MSELIAFEGIDCAGKTSLINRLMSYLDDCIVPISHYGELKSPLAPILRKLLNNGGSPFLKTFLFACDRAWSYEESGLLSNDSEGLILWDRYVDTAIIYRTVELNKDNSTMNLDFVKKINSYFRKADLTIFIDISAETSTKRSLQAKQTEPYDMEFLQKARKEYLKLATENEYFIINGEPPIEEVIEQTAETIKSYYKELF